MKTQEQLKNEVVNYLTRTSQHLFMDTKGSFYKVFVDGDKFILIPSYSYVGSDQNNNANKLKSIPYFKAMREKHTQLLDDMKKQAVK